MIKHFANLGLERLACKHDGVAKRFPPTALLFCELERDLCQSGLSHACQPMDEVKSERHGVRRFDSHQGEGRSSRSHPI